MKKLLWRPKKLRPFYRKFSVSTSTAISAELYFSYRKKQLNTLESPISECKQNLRNSSPASGGPLDCGGREKLRPSHLKFSISTSTAIFPLSLKGKTAEYPQYPRQVIPYQKDNRAHAHGRKSPRPAYKKPSCNPLQGPSPCSAVSGILRPKLQLADKPSRACIGVVCLNRCQLLGGSSDSQSWAQH